PRTELERKLVEIFENVLDFSGIGIEDNFFELGGDSIKAIRVVSQIRELNYEISVKDVIKCRTINSIVKKLKNTEYVQYNQQEVTGKVLSTPIQKEFKSWNFANESHFNQDVMLRKKSFDESAVKEALRAIVMHHDVLRAVYKNDSMEILSINDSKMFDITTYDLREVNDLEVDNEIWNISSQVQETIDLQSGPLMKVMLFHLKEEDRLIIAIHHLVVDGISWRIILEDFEKAYNQYLNQETITLPKKTASYKEWAEALDEYKDSKQLKKEKDYWLEVNKKISEGNINNDINESDEFNTIIITLDNNKTYDLLYKCNKKYGTEINDLLLSALSLAMNKTTNQQKLSVSLEGHGREEIHKKIAIDRTVGWFTSIYPIVLSTASNIENTIINTKEMLRKIPNKGMGYLLIKHNNEEVIFNEDPKLCFNYLGNFDNLTSNKEEANNEDFIDTSFGPTGETSSILNKSKYDFIINGKVEERKFQFLVTYNKGKFSENFIEKFNNSYLTSLEEIIQTCLKDSAVVKTPSDFDLLDIEINEFEKI
ncbi:MAG: condensation domain-containing protein, partial [Clostridium sp.]